jgi:hypothetical protein
MNDATKTARREKVTVRLDPVDLRALDEERQRRAEVGEVVDRSSLVREAVRRQLGGER